MKLRAIALPLMLMMLAYSCNAQTSHEADLSWGASTFATAKYKVFRSAASGGTKTQIATGLSTLTYVDPLPANTSACYTVVAYDPTGNLADANPTNEVCGTSGRDQVAPAGSLTVVFK